MQIHDIPYEWTLTQVMEYLKTLFGHSYFRVYVWVKICDVTFYFREHMDAFLEKHKDCTVQIYPGGPVCRIFQEDRLAGCRAVCPIYAAVGLAAMERSIVATIAKKHKLDEEELWERVQKKYVHQTIVFYKTSKLCGFDTLTARFKEALGTSEFRIFESTPNQEVYVTFFRKADYERVMQKKEYTINGLVKTPERPVPIVGFRIQSAVVAASYLGKKEKKNPASKQQEKK